MLNKIFVFWGIALVAILVIENIVWWSYAYIFLDSSWSSGTLSLVSSVIWIFIWYGIKWFISDKKWDFNENDF